MGNVTCMENFAAGLAARGVAAACISPGSRSSPLTLALAAHPGIDCHVLLDERSAAFCALGIARVRQEPVVVVCTSGTAAAEFHAAVVEADLAQVPLLIVTTDRPPELHGVGASQTIEQTKLYGDAVREYVEAPVPDADAATVRWFARAAARVTDKALGTPPGPVHMNISFREPLVERTPVIADAANVSVHSAARLEPAPALVEALATAIAGVERGVIVCGARPQPLDRALGTAIDAIAGRLGWPVIADVTSGIRFGTSAADRIISHADLIARAPAAADIEPDVVVRVGSWPISKPVAALISAAPRHVLVDPWTWSDPEAVVTDFVRADAAATLQALSERSHPRAEPHAWIQHWEDANSTVAQTLDRAWTDDGGLGEARLAHAVVAAMPAGAALCVGASMPLRDIDAFAPRRRSPIRIISNRGANGIDGFVSTVNGVAIGGPRPVLALCGDLTLAHDGLALQHAVRDDLPVTFIVPDNNGGGIFGFLPQASLDLGSAFDRYMIVPDAPRPGALASAAGCDIVEVTDPSELAFIVRGSGARNGPLIVTVPSGVEATVKDHDGLWTAAADALEARSHSNETEHRL